MISISTAYWPALDDGQKILEEADRLGFSSLEISSYTGRKAFEEMLPSLRGSHVSAVSLHNPCPKYEPKLFPWESERPEPQFSAESKEERRAAIDLACKTLETAADLEARAVVLHLGKTAMPSPSDALKEMFDRERTPTDEGQERIGNLFDERTKAGEAIWDPLSFSLEALTRKAERLDVLLGIENRIHFHEFPTYEEIRRILGEFQGGNFGYWHDIGHATVHQNLGLANIEAVLSDLGEHLIGLHIHDAKGYKDHIAPGHGDADYTSIVPYLTDETLKILEVHPQAAEEELPGALELLKEAGVL